MSFHENLIQTRKLRGMTQEELAEKLDISRQAVSKWENGESVPDIDKLIRLGDILDVSLDELTGKAPSSAQQTQVIEKRVGVRPMIALLVCLLAALCGFALGWLLHPSDGADRQPTLPEQLTVEHVEILHSADGATTIRFACNVTLDGIIYLCSNGLPPRSAEAKWSDGIYLAELKTSAENFEAFDTLTFVVESDGVQRSVLLASDITFDRDGGVGFIPTP